MVACSFYRVIPLMPHHLVHSPSSALSLFYFILFFGFETSICCKFSSLPHSNIVSCHFLIFVLSGYLFKIQSSNIESNSFPYFFLHSTRHHLIHYCVNSSLDYKLKKAGIFVCYNDCLICLMKE